MMSGLIWKYLNGSRFAMDQRYETTLPASTRILLTPPLIMSSCPPKRCPVGRKDVSVICLHPQS